MIDREEFEELKKVLLNHCYDMGILKRNAEKKKKKAIIDCLAISVINAGLSLDDVKECIEDVKKDEVINLDFFNKGGNLFDDFVNPKWRNFAKELYTQRSVGLRTPNAASGEGELMFLFLSKKIKKPTRGDLKIKDEIVELKGEDYVRVMGDIRGKDFREKTLKVCKKYGLTPNKAIKTNVDAVEIEKKPQYNKHWKYELRKLNPDEQKQFINDWLKCIDNKDHYDAVGRIFKNDYFDHDSFVKEIIKILYKVMVSNEDFVKFVVLGYDKNSHILSRNINEFNKKVDNGEIIPNSDYFRINQAYRIGWYISFSN